MTMSVLILGGGPDPERDVSLESSREVAQALRATGRFHVHFEIIDRPTLRQLREMPGDVIWPVLHGRFGEGGPMQLLLEADGRPFVGSGSRASRCAIDKVLTKTLAQSLGMRVSPTAMLDPQDATLPMSLPFVVKPVFEGSTIGLYVCRTEEAWRLAHASSAASARPCLIEPYVAGRELTVGLIGPAGALNVLPIIEIRPAEGLYDYAAKYTRHDTRYIIDPDITTSVARDVAEASRSLVQAMGVRHLARVDFMLDAEERPWLLEINTMPGFTTHSLVPMAAASAGTPMAALCAQLVELAAVDTLQPTRTKD